MGRRVERFEFSPGDAHAVTDYMAELGNAADGWINLLPGLADGNEEEPIVPSVLGAIFAPKQPATTMCTWVAPKRTHRGMRPVSVGILHPRGRVVAKLASFDIPVPTGWRVTQDHVRRGLVLQPASSASNAEVLDWTLRAGAALCAEPLTGLWQASVYLPAASG